VCFVVGPASGLEVDVLGVVLPEMFAASRDIG
jgi:hypothetical protein